MVTRLSDLRSKLEHRKGSFEDTASEVHNFELAGRWLYKQKQRIIIISIIITTTTIILIIRRIIKLILS